MIRLKNIVKKEKTIEADYYPEDSAEKGHVIISLPDGEFVSIREAPGYENTTCPVHVRYELLRLAKRDKMPEEKNVMWY